MNMNNLTGEERVWYSALFLHLIDAYKGPRDCKPSDKEHHEDWLSRRDARDDVATCGPILTNLCDNIGIQADRVSSMFNQGKLTRAACEYAFGKIRRDMGGYR